MDQSGELSVLTIVLVFVYSRYASQVDKKPTK